MCGQSGCRPACTSTTCAESDGPAFRLTAITTVRCTRGAEFTIPDDGVGESAAAGSVAVAAAGAAPVAEALVERAARKR